MAESDALKVARIAAEARVEIAKIYAKEHTKRFRSALKAGFKLGREDISMPGPGLSDDDDDSDAEQAGRGGSAPGSVALEEPLRQFIGEACTVGGDDRVPTREFFDAVRRGMPETVFNKKILSGTMRALGYHKRSGRVGRKTVQCFYGLRLRER